MMITRLFITFILVINYHLIVAQSYSLTDNLIAVYKLNGNANDSLGINNGVLYGPALAQDRFNQANSALSFDGIDDYISITPGFNFKPTTFPISISAWAKCYGQIGQGGAIFSNDAKENHYNGVNMAITTNTNQISALYGDGGLCYPQNRRNKVGNSDIGDSEWHLYTIIFRGPTDMDIYIDCKNDSGIYLGSGSGLAYSNANGEIGRFDQQASGNPPYFYFKGVIDEIRFYHRELFPDDIYRLMKISPFNIASVSLPDTIALCNTTTLSVSQWSGSQLLWNNGNTTASFEVNTPGLYKVTVTDTYGCSAGDSVYVQLQQNNISISNDTTICKGQSVQLFANSNNFSWLPNPYLNCLNCSTQNLNLNDTQTFYVQYGNGACADTASVTVIVKEYIIASVDKPFIKLCKGDSVLVTASGLNSYMWFPSVGLSTTNQSSAIISPVTNSTYYVYSPNEQCVIGAQVVVQVDTVPFIESISDYSLCRNEMLDITLNTNASSVWWSPPDFLSCITCLSNVINPQSSVTYTITVSNGVCKDSISFTVNVDTFAVTAFSDTTILEGAYVLLSATQAQSYLWSPSESLSSSTTNPVLATPHQTTTYYVTATNAVGCMASDSVVVRVIQLCNKEFLPAAFTPNRDGINDIYKIVNPQDIDLIEFSIYNRWGQQIFTTSNPQQGWDGSIQNKAAEIGTYVYVLRYLCNNDEVIRHGNLTLLR